MNKKLLPVILTVQFLLISASIFGQGFCGSTGAFTLNPSEGCAPLSIAVKNQIPEAGNVSYVYNFNRSQTTFPDKKDITADSSYIYQNPGTYTILQFGSSKGTGFSLCKDVKVYETRAPKAELTACRNGRVKLTLEKDSIANAYDQIEINWGDGSPLTFWKTGESLIIDHTYPANSKIPAITIRGQYASGMCQSALNTRTLSDLSAPSSLNGIKIDSIRMTADGKAELHYKGIEGVTTEILMDNGGQFVSTGRTSQSEGGQLATIDNLNPGQIYQFKLVSRDFCDNPVESEIAGSVVISEGTVVLDEIISLSWMAGANADKILEYQVVRDGKKIFTSADQLSYLDSDVKCGTNYTYEIMAVMENGTRSFSALIILSPKSSSPEVISKASVSVQENNRIVSEVELSGKGLTSTYDLIIERADSGNSDFQKISGPQNASLHFEDHTVNTAEKSYCYRFSYKNACNLSSPSFSEPVCSILLTSNAQEVVWNPESPFTVGTASYNLIQINAAGNVTEEIPKQLNHGHSLDMDTQPAFSFRVKASSMEGNLVSYSNILQLKRDAVLLIPDVFTPNGDGMNEKFEVKSYFNSSFEMSIYNRWGELVFYSEDAANGWDGTIHGRPAPAGYYVFKINTQDNSERLLSRSGSLLLVR